MEAWVQLETGNKLKSTGSTVPQTVLDFLNSGNSNFAPNVRIVQDLIDQQKRMMNDDLTKYFPTNKGSPVSVGTNIFGPYVSPFMQPPTLQPSSATIAMPPFSTDKSSSPVRTVSAPAAFVPVSQPTGAKVGAPIQSASTTAPSYPNPHITLTNCQDVCLMRSSLTDFAVKINLNTNHCTIIGRLLWTDFNWNPPANFYGCL